MDEIQAGQQAERLLNDQVFQQAVQQADEAFVQMWRQADNPEDRERAHALQAALGQVIAEMGIIIGRGDIAASKQ